MDLFTLIRTANEAGAAAALEKAGITSGEITQKEATRIYGSYFTQAVSAGRLRPVRHGSARNSAKYFRVTDILNLRTADEAAALMIDINSTHKAI